MMMFLQERQQRQQQQQQRRRHQPSNMFCALVVVVVVVVNVLGCLLITADAFAPSLTTTRHNSNTNTSSSTSALACICINCALVTECKAYHFVESKHEQPHIYNGGTGTGMDGESESPPFSPRDGSPTIHVNIRNTRTRKDKKDGSGSNHGDEMSRLWSEHAEQTRLAEERAAIEGDSGNTEINNSGSGGEGDDRLMGEEQYDLSVQTTYEYDVVACEDYKEDMGIWIRNMPEEIRLANPDFVPS